MSNFALNGNQEMLTESARRYFERGYGSAVRAASLSHPNGCVPERWTEIAEMGWLAMPLPEDQGGLGASLADMCVLAEEMGRALLVEPWLASSVLASTLRITSYNVCYTKYYESGLRWQPKDFVPVTRYALSPSFILVPVNSPARTVQDYVALARAKPGLPIGDGGAGSTQSMATRMLATLAGLKFVV